MHRLSTFHRWYHIVCVNVGLQERQKHGRGILCMGWQWVCRWLCTSWGVKDHLQMEPLKFSRLWYFRRASIYVCVFFVLYQDLKYVNEYLFHESFFFLQNPYKCRSNCAMFNLPQPTGLKMLRLRGEHLMGRPEKPLHRHKTHTGPHFPFIQFHSGQSGPWTRPRPNRNTKNRYSRQSLF